MKLYVVPLDVVSNIWNIPVRGVRQEFSRNSGLAVARGDYARIMITIGISAWHHHPIKYKCTFFLKLNLFDKPTQTLPWVRYGSFLRIAVPSGPE